mmetsp:Transcript_900/g.1993  ORF Transcript_900/g.1993 Transcript_900/m.1993 type:complete len:209 (+) Transcript_900:818-1444(+)
MASLARVTRKLWERTVTQLPCYRWILFWLWPAEPIIRAFWRQTNQCGAPAQTSSTRLGRGRPAMVLFAKFRISKQILSRPEGSTHVLSRGGSFTVGDQMSTDNLDSIWVSLELPPLCHWTGSVRLTSYLAVTIIAAQSLERVVPCAAGDATTSVSSEHLIVTITRRPSTMELPSCMGLPAGTIEKLRSASPTRTAKKKLAAQEECCRR